MKEILLVEDSPSDADLVQRALRGIGIVNPVRWMYHGMHALMHLEQVEAMAAISPTVPAVLFLDLKLPGADGFEILKWLEGRAAFNKMLTVVLSHVNDLESITRAYQDGAYSFLPKPVQALDLRQLIRSFPGHWMFAGNANWVPVAATTALSVQDSVPAT